MNDVLHSSISISIPHRRTAIILPSSHQQAQSTNQQSRVVEGDSHRDARLRLVRDATEFEAIADLVHITGPEACAVRVY